MISFSSSFAVWQSISYANKRDSTVALATMMLAMTTMGVPWWLWCVPMHFLFLLLSSCTFPYFFFLRNVPPHVVLSSMAMRAEIRRWRVRWAGRIAAWASLARAAAATICYVVIPLSRKCCTCQHRRQRNAPHASAIAALAAVVVELVAPMNLVYCIK